jgi:hypothetical protein
MQDNGIEIQGFHPSDKTSQLFRTVPEQTFTGIESPNSKRCHTASKLLIFLQIQQEPEVHAFVKDHENDKD